jgi:DNA-binding MarR family transcriptional regulator
MQELFELFLRSVAGPFGLFSRIVELEKMPKRSEMLAILVLSLRGELSMSALAAELGAPMSTLTSVARRLVRLGYATRRRAEADGRVSLLRLTARGRATARRAASAVEAVFERVKAAVDPDDLSRLVELVMKAIRAASSAARTAEGAEAEGAGRSARSIPID